jgi:benzoyl-CoA reductase/2-hydroxyglutaryl-CoA dehydratase subunit BcrC/BadD/HgdB
MAEEKSLLRKKIRATGEMARLMGEYYHRLDEAARSTDRKVAWCTSVGPVEILRALGFEVYFPENHAAMLGSARLASDLIPHANALGYSPEICSYLTSDIGAFVRGITPLSKAYPGIESVPRPDVLVFNTNQCRDVQDWLSWYAREFKVPVMGVHTHRGVADVTEAHIASIAAQLESLVSALEPVAGRSLDPDELARVIALSRECSVLWERVLKTAVATPSPLTFFDGTIHMGPAVVLRGTPAAVEYYELLLVELEERVAGGEAAVEDEGFRLYWEGMPIWGRLRAHSELFARNRASVLASTYCKADPFRSMARAYTELFIVRSDEVKEMYIKEMVDLFSIDGIIFHDAKTCPHNTNSRYGMPQRLEGETGVPSVIINGDLNDLRCLSDEQTETNVEAFIEQLAETK